MALKYYLLILILLFVRSTAIFCQDKVITLENTINLAVDSSLQILNARNEYKREQWQYHNFKVYHLPILILQTTPIAYNRVFVKRYDLERNIDFYREQQSLFSSGSLSLQQNFGLTGGKFIVDTEIDFIRNFGFGKPFSQFSSIPFRIGYSQNLFSFNPYKWDKQIEPIKYEKARKKISYEIAMTTEKATEVFFDLAASTALLDLAQQQLANADTLYKIGLERYNIGLLSRSDLLALKLKAINLKSAMENAAFNRKRSYNNYCNFLRIENQDEERKVKLPIELKRVDLNYETAVLSALKNSPFISEIQEKILSAERALEQAKKAHRFTASFSASIGFNQVAKTFSAAYKSPLQQNMISVSLTIPILDWGVGKGKIIMADDNLKMIKVQNQQIKKELIQEVIISINELNLYLNHFLRSIEAKENAKDAYSTAQELFIIGKSDVSNLNLAISGQIEAHNNYIQALRNYWSCYYKIKRLTLMEDKK